MLIIVIFWRSRGWVGLSIVINCEGIFKAELGYGSDLCIYLLQTVKMVTFLGRSNFSEILKKLQLVSVRLCHTRTNLHSDMIKEFCLVYHWGQMTGLKGSSLNSWSMFDGSIQEDSGTFQLGGVGQRGHHGTNTMLVSTWLMPSRDPE